MSRQTRKTDSAIVARYRTGITVVCAAVTCFLLLSVAARAVPIGYSIGGIKLVQLDLGTGAFSTIGNVGVLSVVGATIGFDGYMYAVGEIDDDLWRIDLGTASSSLIGGVGVDVGAVTGLTFDACGVLWMVTNRRLYSLDPNTGAATLVRDLGIEVYGLTARGENLFGLVNDGADTLLARIDPETGAVNPFGDLVFLPTQRKGLDFDADGRLWGLYWIEGFIPMPQISSIVEYAPVSGAILNVREIPEAQLALAIGGNLAIAPPQGVCGAAATDIPGLSAGGLLVLAVLLAGTAVGLLRRST